MNECDQSILDDIEDIGTIIQNENTLNTRNNRNQLVPRFKKRKGKNEESKDCNEAIQDSIIPGTQKIYVKTWGCAHNNSDSEYMAGLLAQYGYKIIDEPENADLWLLNSCTVKGPAEDHFRNAVEAGMEQNKHVVVAGCVPQSAPKNNYLRGLSMIGVQQIERVVEVVEETLKGHSVQVLGNKKENGRKTGGANLSLPKIRKNPLIEIIPISTGCLNQCTYCKTKHARGQLGSYSVKEIVERAIQAFEEGVKEIWLTSEDTGAYGIDIGTTLPELLRNLVQVIPEGCMLRLGMTNPPYILNHIEAMVEIFSHPRVYAFLHIPVQSGSDCVLGDMKREYCIEDFEKIVQFLREKVPGLTIATDIICGFPTETEKDFEETMNLVEKYKFPSLFINQFYPRPGTPAAKMRRVPAQEVKTRTKRLTELFQSYRTYDHRVGQSFPILVTELSHDKLHYVGHNKYYEQVLIPKEEHFMGKEVLVKISSAGKHFLIGEPVSEKEIKLPEKKIDLTQNNSDINEYLPQMTKWFTPLWCISCVIVVAAALLSKLYASSWFSI